MKYVLMVLLMFTGLAPAMAGEPSPIVESRDSDALFGSIFARREDPTLFQLRAPIEIPEKFFSISQLHDLRDPRRSDYLPMFEITFAEGKVVFVDSQGSGDSADNHGIPGKYPSRCNLKGRLVYDAASKRIELAYLGQLMLRGGGSGADFLIVHGEQVLQSIHQDADLDPYSEPMSSRVEIRDLTCYLPAKDGKLETTQVTFGMARDAFGREQIRVGKAW